MSDLDQRDGCISDIVGPVGWSGAVVVIAFMAWWFSTDWLNDRDDARLDGLRQTAIEACAESTESVSGLRDCVDSTLAATGQPT